MQNSNDEYIFDIIKSLHNQQGSKRLNPYTLTISRSSKNINILSDFVSTS